VLKVIVLGGTRFIGPHVVRQLAAEGQEIALFNRGESKPTSTLPQNVLQIAGDRNRLTDYREQFRAFAPDVVNRLVSLCRSGSASRDRGLLGIAKRVVTISSCDVYQAFGRLNYSELRNRREGEVSPS
jgi:NAD(P)-dependent dehydrogenase (short-subunit alcohol dehydrogenase family)